mmetsp:Transcript_27248/g.70028  ORF Transcript_27248/g.70028 Transcript_27248/m.70028 type:complete len:225 (+) Transcript_27248:202-876(+)
MKMECGLLRRNSRSEKSGLAAPQYASSSASTTSSSLSSACARIPGSASAQSRKRSCAQRPASGSGPGPSTSKMRTARSLTWCWSIFVACCLVSSSSAGKRTKQTLRTRSVRSRGLVIRDPILSRVQWPALPGSRASPAFASALLPLAPPTLAASARAAPSTADCAMCHSTTRASATRSAASWLALPAGGGAGAPREAPPVPGRATAAAGRGAASPAGRRGASRV